MTHVPAYTCTRFSLILWNFMQVKTDFLKTETRVLFTPIHFRFISVNFSELYKYGRQEVVDCVFQVYEFDLEYRQKVITQGSVNPSSDFTSSLWRRWGQWGRWLLHWLACYDTAHLWIHTNWTRRERRKAKRVVVTCIRITIDALHVELTRKVASHHQMLRSLKFSSGNMKICHFLALYCKYIAKSTALRTISPVVEITFLKNWFWQHFGTTWKK